MYAPVPGHAAFPHPHFAASSSYAPSSSGRLEELERMVVAQQREAARLQSLIYSERSAIAQQQQQQQQQMLLHQQFLRQQQAHHQSLYYPSPHAMSYAAAHPYPSQQQPFPVYMHASPFVAHGHPMPPAAVTRNHQVDPWQHSAPFDPERLDSYEDLRRSQRSRSSERRRMAEMEVTDRPRRSSSRSRAASPPTNASRYEAEVSLPSRRSMGGFSTRSSSAPRSPSRPRSSSRGKDPLGGGCTVDPESEESKKARDKMKRTNIIELEAAKQERKSEIARRKKQAFNAEMTEYFRSKALKTPEVAYSRRFDSMKEWKDTYLQAKAEAGAEQQRAKSPPPPHVMMDTETSYTGTTTESLDRLFNAPVSRRAASPPPASYAPATAYTHSGRSDALLQDLAPEDAARARMRSGSARGSFERFDDVSEQSSLVDTDRSARLSSRINSHVTSPARAFDEWQTAPAARFERRAASPVSPTPRQQYARVRNRLQGEDASSVQTRDLFANMSLQAGSAGDFEEDDISEALRFPPPPRSSQHQQQHQQPPLRRLSDYSPSPSHLQQYLEAAKLQSPMHPSLGARGVTPPTMHRYATLV